jgi:hypothetical protein
MEEEKEWAFSLDAFLSAENAFLEGREPLGMVLRHALENDQALAVQVSEALQGVRLRDPRNRKQPDPLHPPTPGELFLSENSLKILVQCAQTIQDRLMKVPGSGIKNQDHLNLVDEILKNVRLRAPRFKKNKTD